jgi:hypothetical protein
MTTTARGAIRERVAEEHDGTEQETSFEALAPILLATMMHRREEGEGISPLVLAALLARRREEGEGIQHPLVLAALMGRREEREKAMV